jgi:hypothetical protein
MMMRSVVKSMNPVTMRRFLFLCGVGMAVMLLSGCQKSASNATPSVPASPGTATYAPPGESGTEEVIVDTPLVNVTGVTVKQGEAITFSGRTSVPQGECLYTELYGNDVLLSWWPVGKCFPVEGMDWEISVPLGEEGAPERLDQWVNYRLRVWWPGEPDVASHSFPFELASPPGQDAQPN